MGSSARIHRLGRGNIHTYWSNALRPGLTVAPGDTVIFETLDSSYGRVARDIRELAPPGVDQGLLALVAADAYPEQSTMDREVELPRGHPLTGPVAVTGAEPGDTLVVSVVRVEPAAWGFTIAHADPDRPGLLNDCLPEHSGSYLHVWDLRGDGAAIFKPGIRIPLAPFCGVLGVAPAEPGQHSTVPPGRHGGNLDLRHLTAGSTLHLPVLVAGALLSVGDVHAAQGDGEVSGTGIETAATVTLRLDLISGSAPEHPRMLTSGEPLSLPGPYHVTAGTGTDLRQAARTALRGTIGYLTAQHRLTPAEAYVLASACVDLKISQLVNMPSYTVAAYLPLGVFE
ncbi:MAG TPA: acetamidase/formamidase family protein [Actinophytocola sp.]|uniref:acetamidase/formamidase family protein n=1 Tax=Actinophytocola sp. TaxID=1872138 RepID=UPI002DBA44CA|nr:acetamidase/formamidase family protein [Actinophytocola sp.]HEU5474294.1 acetamidase/formamidase family protein [Actinophytocola sp.]